MTELLAWMTAVPNILVYLALGAGAAVENILPAVPADTFVALGGFLAGVSDLDARWVGVSTWLANVTGALAVYRVSYMKGSKFFADGIGRHVMKPHQMARMAVFYERWGLPAIFFSRFLPGIRAVVPVFAGATHQPTIKVAIPIALASGIWYGGLVWLGLWAGQNLGLLGEVLGRVNTTLAVGAAVVGAAAFLWWWTTRRDPDE